MQNGVSLLAEKYRSRPVFSPRRDSSISAIRWEGLRPSDAALAFFRCVCLFFHALLDIPRALCYDVADIERGGGFTMTCPYCGQAMTPGTLVFDARCPAFFVADGEKLSLGDRISGKGRVDTRTSFWQGATMSGAYCDACRKLILDTQVHT